MPAQKDVRQVRSQGGELLSQLGDLLPHFRKASPAVISKGVHEAVKPLEGNATRAELELLRDTACQLAAAVDNLIDADLFDPQELAAAIRQDKVVQAVLRQARGSGPPKPMVTEKSRREGDKFRARAESISMAATAARIASGELISSQELQDRLGVSHRAVKSAVDARRLFSIRGPSDELVYPAFFADQRLDRRHIEKISKELRDLPGQVKYGFFISKSEQLGETPLEALRNGRVKDVLRAAAGFMTR